MDNKNKTRFCEKCGKQIKDSDRFCEHCGAEVKSLPMTLTNENPNDIKSDKKSKKKLVVIISVASAVAVVLAVCAIVFVPKIFGSNNLEQTVETTTQQVTKEVPTAAESTTVEPTTVDPLSKTEDDIVKTADNEFGYVFNINPSEFEIMYNNAVTKLGIDKKYKIKLSDFKTEEVTFLDADAVSYSYENEKLGAVEFTANYASNQIEWITSTVNIDKDNTDSSEDIMNNRSKILMKMLNPDLSEKEVQNMANTLYKSETRTIEGARTTFNNCVYYYLAQYEKPDRFEIGCLPVTEEYYENLNYADESSATEPETSKDDGESNSNGDGRCYFNGFSIDVPEDYTYEVDGDKVTFYESYNHEHPETGSDGFLFAIDWTYDGTVSIDSRRLGSKDGKYFMYIHPTGVGMLEDEYANQRMVDARAETDDVLSSFRVE